MNFSVDTRQWNFRTYSFKRDLAHMVEFAYSTLLPIIGAVKYSVTLNWLWLLLIVPPAIFTLRVEWEDRFGASDEEIKAWKAKP